jgi:hypothetical protein
LPKQTIPWLETSTQLLSPLNAVVLGPEPILGPQSIELGVREQNGLRIKVGTHGLEPFAIVR